MGTSDLLLGVTLRWASNPIQEWGRGVVVAILSVASCYRNRNKLQPCPPPWLVCDFTYLFSYFAIFPNRAICRMRWAEFTRSWIRWQGVHINMKKGKFTALCSPSPYFPEFGYFTLFFCSDQQRSVPKCVTHKHSHLFSDALVAFVVVVS